MTDRQKQTIALRVDVVAKFLIAVILGILSWNANTAISDLREVKTSVNHLRTNLLIEEREHHHLREKVRVVEGKVDDHEDRLRDVEQRL